MKEVEVISFTYCKTSNFIICSYRTQSRKLGPRGGTEKVLWNNCCHCSKWYGKYELQIAGSYCILCRISRKPHLKHRGIKLLKISHNAKNLKNPKKTFSDCTKWQVMETEMKMDLLSEAKKKKGSKTGELSSLTRELAT